MRGPGLGGQTCESWLEIIREPLSQRNRGKKTQHGNKRREKQNVLWWLNRYCAERLLAFIDSCSGSRFSSLFSFCFYIGNVRWLNGFVSVGLVILKPRWSLKSCLSIFNITILIACIYWVWLIGVTRPPEGAVETQWLRTAAQNQLSIDLWKVNIQGCESGSHLFGPSSLKCWIRFSCRNQYHNYTNKQVLSGIVW